MWWHTRTTQWQAEKRQSKVHLQRLREDIFNTEELDIQRNTQAHVSMARIHGLNQHFAAMKTAPTGILQRQWP
jgi:hypothetical protein